MEFDAPEMGTPTDGQTQGWETLIHNAFGCSCSRSITTTFVITNVFVKKVLKEDSVLRLLTDLILQRLNEKHCCQ